MQRVNEFAFYELAIKVHRLIDIPSPAAFKDVWWEWWQAREALNGIFELRPLSVCRGAGNRLYQAITSLLPAAWGDVTSTLAANPELSFESWQTHAIREAAKDFETVLAAECQVLDTYFVSKKGAYSTADLVERAHYQIPESVRGKVPQQTRADFDQAGKCIAFDLPTAAAFHLLRGTEAVLREYYECMVPGPKQAASKMRNWGVYIKLLKDHGAEPKITSLLDHLRESYRNPVLHPDENYTDERAQVLFGVCVSALVMMAAAMIVNTGDVLPFPAGGIPALSAP